MNTNALFSLELFTECSDFINIGKIVRVLYKGRNELFKLVVSRLSHVTN